MDSIVKNVAQIPVSDAVRQRLDLPGLLTALKQDFDKLDDLKKTRQKHEARNAVMRFWHSSEIEDAQLDALQLHGELSKKLSQLMLISIAMSRTLNQQQHELAEQQARIQQQTSDIAHANTIMQDQQEQLGEQQAELENLIREYFELKGLTVDGARKLIDIAEQVQHTKDHLTRAFDDAVKDTAEQVNRALTALYSDVDGIRVQSDTTRDELRMVGDQAHLIQDQLGRVNARFDKFEEAQSTRLKTLRDELEQEFGQKYDKYSAQLNRLRWIAGAALGLSVSVIGWVTFMRLG